VDGDAFKNNRKKAKTRKTVVNGKTSGMTKEDYDYVEEEEFWDKRGL